MLFSIISLVTFGDLLQIQYDYNAGSPGSQVSAVHPAVPGGTLAFSALALLLLAAQLCNAGSQFQALPNTPLAASSSPCCCPSQLNGVLAATIVTPIITVGLILMSFFLLVRQHTPALAAGSSASEQHARLGMGESTWRLGRVPSALLRAAARSTLSLLQSQESGGLFFFLFFLYIVLCNAPAQELPPCTILTLLPHPLRSRPLGQEVLLPVGGRLLLWLLHRLVPAGLPAAAGHGRGADRQQAPHLHLGGGCTVAVVPLR